MIYSFSRIKGGIYRGSIEYLCRRIQISRTTVIRSLNELVKKGYLLKTWKYKNGIKYVSYRHSPDVLIAKGITDENGDFIDKPAFFTIYDWMMSKLNLSGHSLTVYALLYSFSNSHIGCYKGTKAYIAKRLNMSVRQLDRILAKLLDCGFVSKVYASPDSKKVIGFRVHSCTEIEESYQYELDTFTEEKYDSIPDFENIKEPEQISEVNNTEIIAKSDKVVENVNETAETNETVETNAIIEATLLSEDLSPENLKEIASKINQVLSPAEKELCRVFFGLLEAKASKIILNPTRTEVYYANNYSRKVLKNIAK